MIDTKKGFTLIELLITIAIISIISTISVFGIRGAQRSGRDAQRRADLENISVALELYYSDCGSYPASLTFDSALSSNCTGSVFTYMSEVPQDPQANSGATYYYSFNAGTYTLCSHLENDIGDTVPSVCGGSNRCGSGLNCNYGFTGI